MPEQMTACERSVSELAILGLSVLQEKEMCSVLIEMAPIKTAPIFKVKGRRFLLDFLLTHLFFLLLVESLGSGLYGRFNTINAYRLHQLVLPT